MDKHRLPYELLTIAHKTAIKLSLDRDALLSGIDVVFAASIPRRSDASAQILTDLHYLDLAGTLIDGSDPLSLWLLNAATLAHGRETGSIFTRCLDAANSSNAKSTAGSANNLSILLADAANPFHPAGALRPDDPTYTMRSCDSELNAALTHARLVAIEGEFQIGKSSLLLRAFSRLAEKQLTFVLDLALMRVDDSKIFHRSFFRKLSRRLGRDIEDWTELENDTRRPTLSLGMDEFAHIPSEIACAFLPPLYLQSIADAASNQLVVCVPISIHEVLDRLGMQRTKYHDGWVRIKVGELDDVGVHYLISKLPPRAAHAARADFATLLRLSQRRPKAVQCICHQLFRAEQEACPDARLSSLVTDVRAYR